MTQEIIIYSDHPSFLNPYWPKLYRTCWSCNNMWFYVETNIDDIELNDDNTFIVKCFTCNKINSFSRYNIIAPKYSISILTVI